MLYHLTVATASSINLCVQGCFTSQESEIVFLRGTHVIELWILNPLTKQLIPFAKQDLSAVVFSMKSLRPPGSDRDHLVVITKKGETFIFQFNFERKTFIKVYSDICEARRPSQLLGHFLIIEPWGRVFIKGAKENMKEVLSVNYTMHGDLYLSPIPFDKRRVEHGIGMHYDIVILYSSERNIISFASTEIFFKGHSKGYQPTDPTDKNYKDYIENTEKQSINFFDIDLKKNEVTSLKRYHLKHKSNFLMAVPGEPLGPGGVLIFCVNQVIYWRESGMREIKRCPIPRQITKNDKDLKKPIIFINCTLFKNNIRFYYLAQIENGDIFKITLAKGDSIELQMQYFCSLPIASALCIFEPDCLFAAYEQGDHALHSISDRLLHKEPVFSSRLGLKDNETFFFKPNSTCMGMTLQVLPSISPVLHMPFMDECKFFVVCGSGKNCSLRRITQGMQMKLEAITQIDELPFKKSVLTPDTFHYVWSSLFSIHLRNKDYVVLSHAEETIVFELKGCNLIRQAAVTGISFASSTRAIRILDDGTIVQVSSLGLLINNTRLQWTPPETSRHIEGVALNDVQLLLLMDKHICYGEFENGVVYMHTDGCVFIEEPRHAVFSDLKKRADFAVVGCKKNYLCVISLKPESLFERVYQIALWNRCSSIVNCHFGEQELGKMKLFIGIYGGDLLVSYLEISTGQLGGYKKYYVGAPDEPVRLFNCGDMILISSNYPWLYFEHGTKLVWRRLSCGKVQNACNYRLGSKFFVFNHPTLRLLDIADMNAEIEVEIISSLYHTPQKIFVNSLLDCFSYFTPVLKERKRVDEMIQGFFKRIHGNPPNLNFYNLYTYTEIQRFKATSSILHIFYPNAKVGKGFEITGATSCSLLFINRENDFNAPHVIVSSRTAGTSEGLLRVFRLGGYDEFVGDFQLIQEVTLENVSSKIHMVPFGTGAVIGVGKEIRIYGLNSEFFLYEEYKYECAPTCIEDMAICGYSIAVKDSKEGLIFVKYKPEKPEDGPVVYAHYPISPVKFCFFKVDTVACTDNYGNITFLKVPGIASSSSINEEELLGELRRSKKEAQPEIDAHFSVGEVIQSLQMTRLFKGGKEVLLYSTISGTIGIFIERNDFEDEMMETLERFVFEKVPVFCEDQISFRAPQKSLRTIVNGDLCEQFINLDLSLQHQFARYFSMNREELFFLLKELRSTYIF